MKVFVLIERVSRAPWHHSRWAVWIARGLGGRGHSVTLACDGISDPSEVGRVRLVVRRPPFPMHKRQPLRFAAWARQLMTDGGFDVALSLTPLVDADVWAPIGPPEHAEAARLVRPNVVSAVMNGLIRPWIPSGVITASDATRRARIARPIIARIGRVRAAPGETALGCAATLDPGEHLDALRRRTREILGIARDTVVLAMAITHHDRPGLGELVPALGPTLRGSGAELLVVTTGPRTVHERLRRTGVRAHVLGTTTRAAIFLAACDVMVVPQTAGAGATGRLVADAVRAGRPVLCARGASGDDLIDAPVRGSPAPGRVVVPIARGWMGALPLALDPAWRREAAMGARKLGPTLTLERLLDRLEPVLEEAALRRG